MVGGKRVPHCPDFAAVKPSQRPSSPILGWKASSFHFHMKVGFRPKLYGQYLLLIISLHLNHAISFDWFARVYLAMYCLPIAPYIVDELHKSRPSHSIFASTSAIFFFFQGFLARGIHWIVIIRISFPLFLKPCFCQLEKYYICMSSIWWAGAPATHFAYPIIEGTKHVKSPQTLRSYWKV